MAIEHVILLSAFARVAGKLDFVSASIWRRTRTLSINIVGHGWRNWIEALAELNLVHGNLGMPKAGSCPSPLSKRLHSHVKKRKKLSGGANQEAIETATILRPSAMTLRDDASRDLRAPPTTPALRPSASARFSRILFY